MNHPLLVGRFFNNKITLYFLLDPYLIIHTHFRCMILIYNYFIHTYIYHISDLYVCLYIDFYICTFIYILYFYIYAHTYVYSYLHILQILSIHIFASIFVLHVMVYITCVCHILNNGTLTLNFILLAIRPETTQAMEVLCTEEV